MSKEEKTATTRSVGLPDLLCGCSKDALAKAMVEEMQNYKMGAAPWDCVLGDPYCECEKGKRCERLP
jgi:hypothetical protein